MPIYRTSLVDYYGYQLQARLSTNPPRLFVKDQAFSYNNLTTRVDELFIPARSESLEHDLARCMHLDIVAATGGRIVLLVNMRPNQPSIRYFMEPCLSQSAPIWDETDLTRFGG
jgi:hypothetical protein